jgi:hypothetical protein
VFSEHSILQKSTDDYIVRAPALRARVWRLTLLLQVRLYLSFHTPNYLLLLLEFCGGGELFRLAAVQRQQRLAEQYLPPTPPPSLSTLTPAHRYVRFYTAEVLHALLYLHSIGYAYRDLKPENILISTRFSPPLPLPPNRSSPSPPPPPPVATSAWPTSTCPRPSQARNWARLPCAGASSVHASTPTNNTCFPH